MEQWSEAQRQPKYKAESLGKLAQHNNAQSSGDTVNDAVAQGKTATLIRGDLADEASDPVSGAPDGVIHPGDQPEPNAVRQPAEWLERSVNSAEAVVGTGSMGRPDCRRAEH